MNCAVCGAGLRRDNKTGRCRLHPDPEVAKRRGASIKRRFDTDPDFRARHKAKAGRQTEAGRKSISDGAKARRIWEVGARHLTPEVIKRGRESIRAQGLGHIPAEYRDLYMELRRKHRVSVADALAAVEQQQATDIARFRREVGL